MQQEFKQCFHSCSVPVVSKGLKLYPQFPKDLPKGIYDAAYTKEDPPIDMEVEQLELVGKHHVPMRSNSKLLRGDSSGVGSSSSASGDAPAAMRALAMFLPALRQAGLVIGGSDINARAKPGLLRMLDLPQDSPQESPEGSPGNSPRSSSERASDATSFRPRLRCSEPPATKVKPNSSLALQDGIVNGGPAAGAAMEDGGLSAGAAEPEACEAGAALAPGAGVAFTAEEYETAAYNAIQLQKETRKLAREEKLQEYVASKKPAAAEKTLKGKSLMQATLVAKVKTSHQQADKAKGKLKATLKDKMCKKGKNEVKMPELSMAKRLKLRPKGCSKCRFKQGCSWPSCFSKKIMASL
jgi:hypothetical protein